MLSLVVRVYGLVSWIFPFTLCFLSSDCLDRLPRSSDPNLYFGLPLNKDAFGSPPVCDRWNLNTHKE